MSYVLHESEGAGAALQEGRKLHLAEPVAEPYSMHSGHVPANSQYLDEKRATLYSPGIWNSKHVMQPNAR